MSQFYLQSPFHFVILNYLSRGDDLKIAQKLTDKWNRELKDNEDTDEIP